MKKIFSILLIIISVFAFSACHGSKTKKEFVIPESFDESKTYEISFWAKNDTNNVQKAIYNNAIAEFEKLYPNIKVTIKNYTDYTRIYSDVITNISTDTTPNVCITYPDYVATYLEGNDVVINLDELMVNEKYGLGGNEVKFESVKREELVEKFINECKINGSYYSIPFMRSSEATYVNEDLVKELGFTLPEVLTWDFIWEVSRKAKEKYTSNNFIPMIYKSTDNMFIQIAKQRGIEYTNEEGDVLLYNEQTKDLLKELYNYKTEALFNTFKNVSYPGNFFNRGNCIFAIDSTAGATWMGSNAPLMDIPASEVKKFKTVVMTAPQTDPNNIKMISQGPSICIFNKKDANEVLASWLFAQYLITTETQVNYAKTEGYIPVTNSAINSNEYQEYLSNPISDDKNFYDVKIYASKIVIDNIDNTFITPVFNGSSLVRSASGSLIEDVFKNKFKPTNEYIDSLYEEMSTLYKVEAKELGELPTEIVIMFICLGIIWIGIACFYGYRYFKKKS